ncbi:MAG: transposase [Ruminococcus sp.]
MKIKAYCFWRAKGLRSQSGVLIAAVAMDMNASYNKLVTKHLPKAQIVYDRFHMQSQFGRDVLGVVRLDEARRHKAKEKEILVDISNDTDKDTMKSLKQEAKSEKQGYSQLKKRACKRCSG